MISNFCTLRYKSFVMLSWSQIIDKVRVEPCYCPLDSWVMIGARCLGDEASSVSQSHHTSFLHSLTQFWGTHFWGRRCIAFMLAVQCLSQTTHTHTHTQTFYGPCSGTTQVSRCQKKSSSGLYGAREDNRGKHTDHPAARLSIWTKQCPAASSLHFYAICPSCHNPLNLSWLATGTKYAGLHTQWLGCLSQTIELSVKLRLHSFYSWCLF